MLENAYAVLVDSQPLYPSAASQESPWVMMRRELSRTRLLSASRKARQGNETIFPLPTMARPLFAIKVAISPLSTGYAATFNSTLTQGLRISLVKIGISDLVIALDFYEIFYLAGLDLATSFFWLAVE